MFKNSKLIIALFSSVFVGCSSSFPTVSSLRAAVSYTVLVAGVPDVDPLTSQGSADGIPGKFDVPNGLALDSNYYYVGDSFNHTIRRVNRSTNSVDTIAGNASTTGHADGNGNVATFDSPFDLLLSGTTLYVSDYNQHCIRAIDTSDPLFPVTTVLGLCGTSGVTDDIGTAARFNAPTGLQKAGGFLYVADSGNQTIRQVDLSNMNVTTVAGTVGSAGTTDDIGTNAKFNTPFGFSYYNDSTDGDVLFIADTFNNTIRRMRLSDFNVTTVAGIAGLGGLVDNDSGLLAEFNFPSSITTDSTYLYVSDSSNRSIRKIRLSDYAVTTYFGNSIVTIDNFGPLTSTTFSGLTTIHYDSQLGLIGMTMAAIFRVVEE